MSHLFKYSVIRYVPDELREEFINIGMIFHSPELEYVDLKFTTDFTRVSAFDDEIDINFLKIILEGIRQGTVSEPTKEELTDYNFIETRTRYYANQIQFSSTQSFVTDDYEKDLNDLFKSMVENHEKESDATIETPVVLVGSAYDFLFEGENNQYDSEYGEYI